MKIGICIKIKFLIHIVLEINPNLIKNYRVNPYSGKFTEIKRNVIYMKNYYAQFMRVPINTIIFGHLLAYETKIISRPSVIAVRFVSIMKRKCSVLMVNRSTRLRSRKNCSILFLPCL